MPPNKYPKGVQKISFLGTRKAPPPLVELFGGIFRVVYLHLDTKKTLWGSRKAPPNPAQNGTQNGTLFF